MEKFEGKAIFKGVAIGRIMFYGKKENIVKRFKIEDTAAEIERYDKARKEAIEQLKKLHDDAVKKVGEENAAIFEVHAMLLEDDDFNDSVHNMIENEEVNAEYATAVTGENFSKMFAEMEDEYFKARSADMKDISERVISVLSGKDTTATFDQPVIIAADDLMPSETVQLDKDKVLAFVTKFGSANSHTAILARTMNIPALINIPVDPSWDGK
ncbi:MAG: phosphoenolpyruvate-utilizing N-terminal domain-containing protein, partial [Bilifractor sp.]|nr:phosphoenolpyruvate-utilizing N-terminal domain-containing protein [Bilifractor sp.]